jgi:hypothetical protein
LKNLSKSEPQRSWTQSSDLSINVNPCEAPDHKYARRTVRGYSAFECLLGCWLVGAATGVPSGGWIPWTVPSSSGMPPVILFFLGTLFGLALWLISPLFVGNATSSQVAIFIAGSVTGFVAAGLIYEPMMAGPDLRPPWTLSRLRPFLIASGVAGVDRVSTGIVQTAVSRTARS